MGNTAPFSPTDTFATTFGGTIVTRFGVTGADWMTIFQLVVPMLLLLLVIAFGWRYILMGFKHVVHRFRPVG